jgi:MoxR-like ATPase
VPGTAKTLLALSLARLLGCRFRRIQFTPDLMPADILGTNVFNQKTTEFQAATIDGVRYRISPVFTVLATQNPVEFEGTYPLPEAQRDRFLMKIAIGYPAPDDEGRILEAYAAGRRLHDEAVAALEPALTRDQLAQSRRTVASSVRVEPSIRGYILRIVAGTRTDETVQIGAGPRGSLALLESARARAALQGRDYVTPDDVKAMAAAVLGHRVTLSPEAEMEGLTLDDVLRRTFDSVEVPR